jgi:ATP synthase protein I
MFWEMVKIALTVTLLALAVKVVPHLSWPALLATMVVCMKVSWLALLGRRSGVSKTNVQRD